MTLLKGKVPSCLLGRSVTNTIRNIYWFSTGGGLRIFLVVLYCWLHYLTFHIKSKVKNIFTNKIKSTTNKTSNFPTDTFLKKKNK